MLSLVAIRRPDICSCLYRRRKDVLRDYSMYHVTNTIKDKQWNGMIQTRRPMVHTKDQNILSN